MAEKKQPDISEVCKFVLHLSLDKDLKISSKITIQRHVLSLDCDIIQL